MRWLPVTASVREVLSLFQQYLHQRTANTCVAVSVDSEGEPRTGNADLGGVAALYYAVVSLTPFLHCLHESSASTDVLAVIRLGGKAAVPVPLRSHWQVESHD